MDPSKVKSALRSTTARLVCERNLSLSFSVKVWLMEAGPKEAVLVKYFTAKVFVSGEMDVPDKE